jgi:hypothetical protein
VLVQDIPSPAIPGLLTDKLRQFAEHGYVVFPSSVQHDLLDRFWEEVEQNLRDNPSLTLSLYGKIIKNSEIRGEVFKGEVARIVDIERHSTLTPEVMYIQLLFHF